ncbi:MAG: HYR domain-containing protein [Crocinitomicaceae bacterium]|nr:MAG: HYR domain-containing protein [Crocinitomicaceae bacterium]
MFRYLLLYALTLLSFISFGQATMYEANFEPPFLDWSIAGDVSTNTWIKNTCAGNGSSAVGTYSFYITKGGIVPGCGATGQEQFAYDNSPSGSKQTIAYTTIDGTCAANLQAHFDYRIEGVASEDIAELVYSTNGGTSWTAVGSAFAATATWSTSTISLPLSLNYSSFLLGVRFTYNDATINGTPIAIDNFSVTGTDNINPVLTCPSTQSLPVSAACLAIADDYTKNLVSLSDNCTDSVDINVTQNIAEGSTIPIAPGGSTTIILTAFDEAGNSAQCSFTLNIVDETLPTITCPDDTVIYTNSNCQAFIENYIQDAIVSDNCSSTFTFIQNPPLGQFIIGEGLVVPVNIIVFDESSNSAQCSFDVLTIDSILPTIQCPSAQNIFANNACQAVLPDYTSLAVVNDNCVLSSSLLISQSPAPGTLISSAQPITLTVSGGIPSGSVSCQFNLVPVDTIKPNVICPTAPTMYVNSSCQIALPDYTSALAWTDNCTSLLADMTFVQNPAGGTLLSSNQTVSITAYDDQGNNSTCFFTQVILDTISPILVCPPNQTLYSNASCVASLPDYVPMISLTENCFFISNVTYVQSPAAASNINGITTITITGTDQSGNDGTCSFTVTPLDTIAPTIVCPSNTTVNTDASCNYSLVSVIPSATISDNCTTYGSLILSQSPVAGTVLATGTHTITITAQDQAGNSSSCSYQLTVADQTIPTISCPGTQNIPVAASCSATLTDYLPSVTVSDNCTSIGQLVVTQSPVSGTVITSNTSVSITVEDLAGNTNTCSFTAVLIDATDPVINCPATVNVAINSSCQYLVPDLSSQVTGSDNCSSFASMTLTQNPPAGATDGGLTAVVITLMDQQGNNATCLTMLTPIDTDAPTITCPSPAPVNNGANCDFALGYYGSTALVLDNCSDYSITQSPAMGTIVQPGDHIITLNVIDAGGNTAECSFTLSVMENVSPTITCPSNISTCDPNVTFSTPVFNDNCLVALVQTDATGLSSGDVFPVGTTTLSFMAIDSSANSQTCSFQIQVLDFPSPAVALEDTISLCQVTSALAEAQAVTSGTGEWTLVSGQATFNNQFANVTGVNNLGYGTNVLAWTISSAQCGETSDTLRIIVSQQPLPASALDTIIACNDPSVQLSATSPLYGIGTWTTAQGATISDIHAATPDATNLAAGWNEFVWTVTNGSCPSSSDTLRVYTAMQATINQADTALCLENVTLNLVGSSPTVGQAGTWSFLSGSGSLSSTNTSSTTLSGLGLGVNIIVYKITNENCPNTSDSVEIIVSMCDDFNPIFPTVITPNFDGKNDLFEIDYLELVYPECKVTIFNRWGSVVFESVGYKDPWDGTFKGEDLPMGTYFYKIELNDDKSTVYNGSISIIH